MSSRTSLSQLTLPAAPAASNEAATKAYADLMIPLTQRAAASGVATLDGSTKVPIAQLPLGTSSSTVTVGNDARLSDARTPTTHASSHASGGGDPVTPAAIGAIATSARGAANGVASLDASTLVPIAQVPTGTSSTTVALGNHNHALSTLTGVSISSPATTQGLIYNGTNWVNTSIGMAVVASLATIAAPITGQLALLTTDSKIYRYNGSAWRVNAGMGGRWRQDTTGQNISNVTDTKITFNTALETAVGISYSAGVFTVLDAGKWSINSAVVYPFTSDIETWAWLGPSAATTTRWDLDVRVAPSGAGPGTTLRNRIERVFTANETFAYWTWQDAGSTKALDVGYGGITHLEATYIGPS